MKQHTIFLRTSFIFALFSWCGTASVALATRFEEQAERLQNVSATLLDSVPAFSPGLAAHPTSAVPLSLGLSSVVSLLPKVSPTVGAKTEKVPSSPVHTVPSLFVSARVPDWKNVSLDAYAGLLPPGGEKIFGIQAKLIQWQVGFRPSFSYSLSSASTLVGAPLVHYTVADMTGRIASHKSTKDSFIAKTLIYGAEIQWQYRDFWASGLFAKKHTHSVFAIADDDTSLSQTDTLQDGPPGVLMQVALGATVLQNFSIGIAEIAVPQRLLMPKLVLEYRHAFVSKTPAADANASSSQQQSTPSTKPRKQNDKKKPTKQ